MNIIKVNGNVMNDMRDVGVDTVMPPGNLT